LSGALRLARRLSVPAIPLRPDRSTLAQIPGALWFGCVAVSLGIGNQSASAQEPTRPSLLRQTFQRFEPGKEGSLFAIGPLTGNLTASIGLQYNDNTTASNKNQEDQLSLFEGISLDLRWPFTAQNTFSIQTGISFNQTLAGKSFGQPVNVTITPESAFQFKFTVGEVAFDLFDQFSLTQDPTSDVTATNTALLNRFSNTIGLKADWDLKKLIFTFQVSDTYVTQNPTSGNNNNLSSQTNGNRNTVALSFLPTVVLTPTLMVGPSFSYTNSSVSGGISSESEQVGVFVRGQLTHLTSFDVAGGIQFISQTGNTNSLPHQSIPSTGYFVQATVSQQVTRFFGIVGNVSHNIDYEGINFTEQTSVTLGGQYRISKPLELTGSFSYYDGKTFSGTNTGPFQLWTVQTAANWRLGRRSSVTFSYRYTNRTSDQSGEILLSDGTIVPVSSTNSGSYNQNVFSVSFNYTF
jgi:hypothetical protein